MKRARLISISPEEVQKIRSDRNWSERQAARIVGVSRSTWRYYEYAGVVNGVIAARLKKILISDGSFTVRRITRAINVEKRAKDDEK